MNPIDIFFNWQTLLVAVICWGVTQAVKIAYDIRLGRREAKNFPGAKASEIGKELRYENPWVNRLVLPGIPVITGAAFVCIVPIRPDVLSEYVAAHEHITTWASLSIFGTWGAACGIFADYIFTKAKDAVQDISYARSRGRDPE